jgi:hypothetical protein
MAKIRKHEMNEGQDAFDRFRHAVKTVIAVPKSALPPRPHRLKKQAVKPKIGKVDNGGLESLG